jgi:enoyl-CoA hydratase/carnithine racemase
VPDVIYEKHSGYAVLRLNRPERLNAITDHLDAELDAAIADYVADPALRCAILTGEGRAFSAGGDLKEMATAAPLATRKRQPLEAVQRFSRCPKPFVAAINGLAVGGGLEYAIDCDIRICSSEAYFGLFEVRRGIVPGHAMHNLARVMPFGDAMYLLLTGDRFSAAEALKVGLVREVVEPAELMPRAVAIAEMIAEGAPLSLEAVKAAAHYWRHLQIDEAYRQGWWLSRRVATSEDAKEGPLSFAEKRKPNWQGR